MKKVTLFLFILLLSIGVNATDQYVEISLDGEVLEKVEIEEYYSRVKALNYFGELLKAEKGGRIFLLYDRYTFHVEWEDEKGKLLKKIDFKVKDGKEEEAPIILNHI
jgi:hypothetical protein